MFIVYGERERYKVEMYVNFEKEFVLEWKGERRSNALCRNSVE